MLMTFADANSSHISCGVKVTMSKICQGDDLHTAGLSCNGCNGPQLQVEEDTPGRLIRGVCYSAMLFAQFRRVTSVLHDSVLVLLSHKICVLDACGAPTSPKLSLTKSRHGR